MVIDPISAFMGNADSHKNSDVRGLLSVLADLAQETQVAVVFVSHLNKGQGSPMSRVTGSVAFVAAARSGMLVGRDPADPDRKIIAMLKVNLSKECKGVAYRIGTGNSNMPVIEWEPGVVDVRPEDILNFEGDNARRERSEAAEWLCAELSHGPVNTTSLQSLAREAGHAWRTVQRAQKELKVKAKKTGHNGSWQWWHPDDLFQDSHMHRSQNVGEVGGLQDQNTLIDGQDRQDSQYRQDIDTGKGAALIAKANP